MARINSAAQSLGANWNNPVSGGGGSGAAGRIASENRQLQSLEKALDGYKSKARELASDFMDGKIGFGAYSKQLSGIEAHEQSVQSTMNDLAAEEPSASNLQAALSDLLNQAQAGLQATDSKTAQQSQSQIQSDVRRIKSILNAMSADRIGDGGSLAKCASTVDRIVAQVYPHIGTGSPMSSDELSSFMDAASGLADSVDGLAEQHELDVSDRQFAQSVQSMLNGFGFGGTAAPAEPTGGDDLLGAAFALLGQ